MKILEKVKSVSKKQALLLASGAVVLSGTAFALVPNSKIGADEQTPIGIRVEDHEQRIGDLEEGLTDVKDQTNQNSADISVIQNNTGISPAPAVPKTSESSTANAIVDTPSAPVTVSEPTAPTNPMTIIAVSDIPVDLNTHQCDYTLYDKVQDRKLGVVNQPTSKPCQAVGQIYNRAL